MKTDQGMTLVELIVTVSIMAVMSVVALPSLNSIMSETRSIATITEINSSIQLARNHAISFGVRVSVCPLADNCCDDNWQNGFSVFTDNGSKACFDGDDQLITSLPSIKSGDTLTYSRTSLRFLPTGLASGHNGTFRYCPDSADSPNSKAVIISNAGRSRISKDNINCK